MRAVRIYRNLSVDAVAARAGVDVSAVYRWEAGDREPSLRNYLAWVNALRIPLSSALKHTSNDQEWAETLATEVKRAEVEPWAPVLKADAVEARLIADGIDAARRGL
jgi:transcriptional regulator with XRE-family HTH domain